MKIEKIRHSLSHLLAMAVLKKFPDAKLGIGPIIENGFYYDFLLPESLAPENLKDFEKEINFLISQKLPFIGKKITAAEAKKIFKNQPFKFELINEYAKEKRPLSIYKTGPSADGFVDLCAGDHIKNSGEINAEAFKLTSIAGAYWRGNEKNPQLQRIYGVAFESKKELEEYLKMMEEAGRCDHRVLNDRLDFFMISEQVGKGLPLWLPKGYEILHKLEDYMYNLEKRNGYFHVLTPILAKEDLYKKSGHLAHYKNDMYAPLTIENEKYYLRPMNCPHHHEIYKHHKRSYRELPLRIAEFGNVYRFERSGVLSGLARARGFIQNDSHIYTDEENLEKEIIAVLKLQKKVYDDFGIKDYWHRLSLPDFKNKEKFGDIKNKKIWQNGSDVLKRALKNTGQEFVEAVGEASFYGPKIDIQTKDIHGKEDTVATIQVDYYSSPRFNLFYTGADGTEKYAVVIHRAIMGSFERFFALLVEKTCGNLPLWIAPVQARLLAVSVKQKLYAEKLLIKLQENNISAELAPTDETVGKRIREAELEKVPYILVVGDKETENKTVNVRHYRRGLEGEIKIEKFVEKIKKEITGKII
ncbi:MAG: threonine--tRNA ligase [Patescibacteria group bacterium]